MTQTFRAHFDGKVLIPVHEVDLPIGCDLAVQVEIEDASGTRASVIEERRARLRAATGTVTGGEPIPLEALRREYLYEDRL
jgi:hypothetical protein